MAEKWPTLLVPLSRFYICRCFKAIMSVTATRNSYYCTCLGHLGWCDTDRIISILCCIAQGSCCVSLLLMILPTNFANENKPLRLMYIGKVFGPITEKYRRCFFLTLFFVLATLGSVTQMGSFQFYVALPKVAVTCRCYQWFCQQTLPM